MGFNSGFKGLILRQEYGWCISFCPWPEGLLHHQDCRGSGESHLEASEVLLASCLMNWRKYWEDLEGQGSFILCDEHHKSCILHNTIFFFSTRILKFNFWFMMTRIKSIYYACWFSHRCSCLSVYICSYVLWMVVQVLWHILESQGRWCSVWIVTYNVPFE